LLQDFPANRRAEVDLFELCVWWNLRQETFETGSIPGKRIARDILPQVLSGSEVRQGLGRYREGFPGLQISQQS